MHTMATHKGGIDCPLDRDVDLNKENLQNAETEIENTHDFGATVALHETEETDTLKVLSITHIQNWQLLHGN